MGTRRWYEVVLQDKDGEMTVSKHKTLPQAEAAMVKFRLIHGGKLRIDELTEKSK